MENKKATKALQWIVNVLESNDILYQIEGGLAAICYGSTRELVDIDIFIVNSDFVKISQIVEKYSQFGPGYHIGKHWRLVYQILNYNDQQIELCDAGNAEYLDTKNNNWVKRDINFSKAETISKFGIKMKVIPKLDLIECKERLGREVDLIDIEQITRSSFKKI